MKKSYYVVALVLYTFIISYCSYTRGRDITIERVIPIFGEDTYGLGIRYYLETGDEKFLDY